MSSIDLCPQRQLVYDTLYRAIVLTQSEAWGDTTVKRREDIARRIERKCFNFAVQDMINKGKTPILSDEFFILTYSLAASKIVANIDPNSSVGSTYLISKLVSGEISEYDVVDMSSCQLCPQASESERSTIENRQRQHVEQKTSSKYTCSKCGGKKTTSIEYQSRASDEAPTFSIRCIQCGHVWRT